jgi:hypothetical protein
MLPKIANWEVSWIFVAHSVDEPLHNLYKYERARNRKSSYNDKDAENHVFVTCTSPSTRALARARILKDILLIYLINKKLLILNCMFLLCLFSTK